MRDVCVVGGLHDVGGATSQALLEGDWLAFSYVGSESRHVPSFCLLLYE